MKMKEVTVSIIGVLLAVSALSEEEVVKPIPNLEQVKIIHVSSGSGVWRARFHPDGSATLCWGALPLDYAEAPAGSFAFEEIYNFLTLHLKPNQAYYEEMNVGFVTIISDEWHTVGWGYVEDMGTIRKIMYGLRDKAVNRVEERFQNALRQCPLVPGDDADGNPILGYVRTPYVRRPNSDDPFADDPPAPKDDDDTEPTIDPEARKPESGNGRATASRLAAEEPAVTKVATASLPLTEDEAQRLEAVATIDAPPSRLWLYAALLSVLCAGAVFWFIRRKN